MATDTAGLTAQSASVTGFALRLLGPLEISTRAGQPVPGLGSGKALAMLAYVAVRGSSRRDELISLLWGDVPESNARNAFRQSLHRLRAALGEALLPMDRELVTLAVPDSLRVDRNLFVAACEAGRWEDATELYTGEFLEDFETGESAFDRWADGERVRLGSRFQEALLASARSATAEGKVREAARFAERLVGVAPYDEVAALLQANTMVAAGQPTQALAALKLYEERLRTDLDIAASPSVRALIERLQKRRETPSRVGHPSVAESSRRHAATFVGRDAEISRLMGYVDRARSRSRGATVLLEGEAGIGKSRLVDEYVERARDLGGVLLLRGHEGSASGVVPYASIAEALRPIVRAAGISGASRHLLAEAARLLPELRDSFELPLVAPVEDETGRLRLFEGIASVIDAAAYEKPVCLILEDVQHSSASTLDLVVYLSQRLRESAVLLVLAYRVDRASSHNAERLRELVAGTDDTGSHQIILGALSPDDTKAIVDEELTRSAAVLRPDVDSVVRRSAGNPFTAIALAREAAQGHMHDQVPVSIRDLLWTRVQLASAAQRRVLFVCSMFQRVSSLRLLAAAAHLPEAATWDAAGELVAGGLLSARDEGYVLAHDCEVGFLVEMSGLAGRALLAGWAADALAQDEPAADAELASLYAMAGRGIDAFTHARAGVFAAASVGSATEVARLLGIALTFAPDVNARREIEALLAVFGGGRLALPGDVAAPTSQAPTTNGNAPYSSPSTDSAGEADVVVEPLADSDGVVVAPDGDRTGSFRAASVRQWAISIAVSLGVIIVGFLARREMATLSSRRMVPDTLVVVERNAGGKNQLRALIGVEQSDRSELVPAPADAQGPAWVDSLTAPFNAPLVSPDRKRIAVQRVSARGAQMLVLSADRRDTLIVAPESRDNLALGWSPDSRALLMSRARTLDDGSFDTDLYLSWISPPRSSVAIDTSSTRAVTEAKWSPNGVWVGWVTRNASSRRRDVFVSRPDGSEMRAIAPHPADDYNIDWSPDGSLLAFTSTRSGARRLYVYDFEQNRLWPISDRDGEDFAHFSPDGRSIAFESTRDGDRAIYVRPALGGTVRRLTPVGHQVAIVQWRGGAPPYVDRLRLVGAPSLAVGESIPVPLLALTQGGASVPARARFRAIDANIVQADTASNDGLRVVGRAPGAGRVMAFIPGWRSDTLTVVVSSAQPTHFADSFDRGTLDDRWRPLGHRAPYIGTAPNSTQRALFPNADGEWDSGVLLQPTLRLRSGLRVTAKLFAPFTGRPSPATLTAALVLATPLAAVNLTAPQFTSLIGVSWDAASGNLTYSVGDESSSESAALLGDRGVHEFGVAIAGDTVAFVVDGHTRWRSSLKFLGDGSGAPVRLWIGGRATGSSAGVARVTVDATAR